MADTEAPHHYKFNVKMSCSGCSGAIDRVLKKTEGPPMSSYFYDTAPAYGLPFNQCNPVC